MGKGKTLDSVLKREIGRNAPDLICNLAASSTIAAIEEFVANSHDSDSTRVKVNYNPNERTLTIEDDGEGMDFHGLKSFYRLGDSPKLENPVTKKGRRCIGKFGIATILLKHLARGYSLDTVKNGKRIVVSERFGKSVVSDKPIPFRTYKPNGKPSGTRIVLRDVRFSEDDDSFSLKELTERLQWDMPMTPDFEVYVNGKKVESKRIESATEYRWEVDGKHMGHVDFILYVTKRPTDDTGIHIYVNGRRVGDPKALLHKSKIRGNLVGIVKADGIEEAILFDRGRFKEDHNGYRELVQTVKRITGKIQWDVDKSRNVKKIENAQKKMHLLLEEEAQLLTSRIPATMRNKLPLEFQLWPLEGDQLAEYDPKTARVILNQNSPFFGVTEAIDQSLYRANVIHATIDAMATALISKKAGLKQFQQKKEEIMKHIYEKGSLVKTLKSQLEGSGATQLFHEMRMYTSAEIARTTNVPIGVIYRLIESNGLPTTDDKSRGDHILAVMDKIKGHISLYEIIHGKIETKFAKTAYDTVTRQIQKFAQDIPFVIDVGKTAPCYFIKQEFAKDVAKLIGSSQLRRRKHSQKNPLIQIANRYLPLPELATSLGMDVSQTKEVIAYAKENDFNVSTRNVKGGKQFNYYEVGQVAEMMKEEKQEGQVLPEEMSRLEVITYSQLIRDFKIPEPYLRKHEGQLGRVMTASDGITKGYNPEKVEVFLGKFEKKMKV